MSFVDYLYWDVLSALASDDTGFWEVAWRARTIGGGRSDSIVAATAVIDRFLDEGLATATEFETGKPVDRGEARAILEDVGWAAVRPHPMMNLIAEPLSRVRIREMPAEAIRAMSGPDVNGPFSFDE